MAILMEKKISIDRMITTNNDVSSALARPTRGKIVELLNKKQLNVEQIRRRLKKLGYKKSVTTIRHHIEILKDSGLIENYSKIISKTSLKLAKVIGPISKNFSKTRKIQQINYNNFIIMEIINRAMTNLLEKK